MLKVLIADDDAIARDGLSAAIDWNELGLEVTGCAENGKQALELFQQHRADIVLTDIRMPYMDGIELTRSIKALEPSTVVVFFSAYDDFIYAKEGIKLGAYDYVLKPIDFDAMLDTVRRAVEHKKQLKRKASLALRLGESDLKLYAHGNQKQLLVLEEKLLKAAGRCEMDKVVEQFDAEWRQLMDAGCSLDFLKRKCLEIMMLVARGVGEAGKNADVVFKEADPWSDISCADGYDELYQYVTGKINQVFNSLACDGAGKSRNKNRTLINLSLRLIQESYSDKELSLNGIAERLFVTPNYLSMLFKTEMGKGFVDFMNEYRVDRAKELLMDYKHKIYEISELVGYSDPHYFSRIFKGLTGMTPKDYRENRI